MTDQHRCIIKDGSRRLFSFQEKACRKFDEMDFPSKKDESYSYFSLLKLCGKSFYAQEISTQKILNFSQNVTCDFLSNIYEQYKLLIDNHYQHLIREETDFFALASIAFSSQTLFISVPKDREVDEFLDIEEILQSKKSEQSGFSNMLIFLGKNAKLKIRIKTKHVENIETLFSRVISVYLDEGSELVIENDLSELDHLWFFDNVRGMLKKDAKLFFVSATQGGLSIRQDLKVDLLGVNSSATLKGLQVLGEHKTAYSHVRIKHLAEKTHSDQHFKQVIFDGGKGVFDGKIIVESSAQQTNAYQLCNSLALGEKALAFAKPNLEIFADDVKASHGATLSKLNKEHIFYLLSRGLTKERASLFLIEGFAREIADFFSGKDVQSFLLSRDEVPL